MLALTRTTSFRLPLSATTLVQQLDRLHISAGNSPFVNAIDAKSSTGFSCSSPTSTLLNVSGNKNFPVFEQRRFRKFFKEWTWNYKHKQGHKPQYKPYFRHNFKSLEGAEYTHKPFRLPGLGGRDPETGHKVNQRIGGGYPFDFFWVDFRRNRFSPADGGCYEERILEVRRAPNQTAYVAMAAGSHGRRWILATENMKAGDVVRSYNYIPNKMLKDYEMPEGDSWPVGALPPGTTICNLQSVPTASYNLSNYGSQFRLFNAGQAGTVLRHQGEFTVVQYKQNKDTIELAVKRECTAVIGRCSNGELNSLHWGSMNMKRRWGIKQGTGVWHKKDQYCGRKAHPLRKITMDPDKMEAPPIKIPVTLTRKDFASLFGTAVSAPKFYKVEDTDTNDYP